MLLVSLGKFMRAWVNYHYSLNADFQSKDRFCPTLSYNIVNKCSSGRVAQEDQSIKKSQEPDERRVEKVKKSYLVISMQ